MSDENKKLYYLEELSDYEVASDYSDVRGWDVTDVADRKIGKVTNLLVNKEEERVVYLDVEVDKTLIDEGYETYQAPASTGVHGFVNKEGDDHIIVPIGMVELDEAQKKVVSEKIDYETFTRARRFSRGAEIKREYELALLQQYSGEETETVSPETKDFYKRKEFCRRKGTE